MKNKEQFTRCEYCDQMMVLQSPPKKESYENAQIEINSGTILLPKKVAEKSKKKGFSLSHAMDLNGFYCNPKCLRNKIDKILNP